jgi:hypothetical protein
MIRLTSTQHQFLAPKIEKNCTKIGRETIKTLGFTKSHELLSTKRGG